MKYDIIRRDIFKMHFVLYKIMYSTNYITLYFVYRYFILCISLLFLR